MMGDHQADRHTDLLCIATQVAAWKSRAQTLESAWPSLEAPGSASHVTLTKLISKSIPICRVGNTNIYHTRFLWGINGITYVTSLAHSWPTAGAQEMGALMENRTPCNLVPHCHFWIHSCHTAGDSGRRSYGIPRSQPLLKTWFTIWTTHFRRMNKFPLLKIKSTDRLPSAEMFWHQPPHLALMLKHL